MKIIQKILLASTLMLSLASSATAQPLPSTGTVYKVNGGPLNPLFTCTVSNPYTNPTLGFSFNTATANQAFITNGSGVPTWGVTSIPAGGTNNGSLAVTAGGLIYTDGTMLQNTGAGTSHQVAISNGASAPSFASLGYGSAILGTTNFNEYASSSSNSITLASTDLTTQLLTTGSSATTVNLPAASTVTHKIFLIKKVDSGVGQITVTPNGSDKIDGASSVTIADQYDYTAIQSDGTNWNIIGQFALGGGSGSVTNVSISSLSPLFTASVSNPSSTPSITFALNSSVANHNFFGNNTGSTGSASFTQPAFTDISGVASDSTQLPVTLSGHTLAGTTTLSGNLVPNAAATINIGTFLLPLQNIYLGTAANQSINFNTGALTSTQSIYVPNGSMAIPLGIAGVSHKYLTSFSASTGAFTAVQPSSADLSDVSNLAMVNSTNSFTANQIPGSAGAYDLGSTSKPWRNFYGTDNSDTTHYYSITAQSLTSNVTLNVPNANTTAVQPLSFTSHFFVNALNGTTGVLATSQPALTDLQNLSSGSNYQVAGLNGSGAPAYLFTPAGLNTLTTSNTALTAGSESYELVTPGSSSPTETLPAASTCKGKAFIFEQVSGSGTVSIAANGSDTIEGLSTTSLITQTPLGLVSDGTSTWRYLFPSSSQAQINRLIAFAQQTTNYFGNGSNGALLANSGSTTTIGSGSGFEILNYSSIHITNNTTVTAGANCQALLIYCQGNCQIDSGSTLTMGTSGVAGAASAMTIKKLTSNVDSGDTFSSENGNQSLAPAITTFTVTAAGGTGGTAGSAGAIAGSGGNGGNGNTATNGTGGGGGGGGGGGASATTAGVVGAAGSAGTAYTGGGGGGGGRGGASPTSGGSPTAATAGLTNGAGGGNGGNAGNSSAGGGGGGGGGGAGTTGGTGGTGGTSVGSGLGLTQAGSAGSSGTSSGAGTLIVVVGGALINNGSINSNAAPNNGGGGSGGAGGTNNLTGGGAGGGGGGNGGGRVITLYGVSFSGNTPTATGGAGGSPGFGGPSAGAGGTGGTGGNGSVTLQQILPAVY